MYNKYNDHNYLINKNYEKSIECFCEEIRLNNSQAYFAKASALNYLRYYEQDLVYFNEAICLEKYNSEFYFSKGLVHDCLPLEKKMHLKMKNAFKCIYLNF